jgi:hypothetical protein
MFTHEDKKPLAVKFALVVCAALVLGVIAWASIYFFLLDGYVRDQARVIGNLQARVQTLEEQERLDQQDINDLYDQLNGSGDGTDQTPSGGVAPPAPAMPGHRT